MDCHVKRLRERQTTHGQARSYVYRMWAQAKARAKKAALPFDLDWRDITIPEQCPILGIPLIASHKRVHGNNPSLDRLEPAKGYTKDNTWVISWRANHIKGDANAWELAHIAEGVWDELVRRSRSNSTAEPPRLTDKQPSLDFKMTEPAASL